MAEFVVPETVRVFIVDHISSIEALEILLWMRRRGDEVDAEVVAQELRSSVPSVAQRVVELTDHGLLRPGKAPGSFVYAPDTSALDAAVAMLADCYRLAPFRTMELVYSKPADKIQTFAEAFKFKKERD